MHRINIVENHEQLLSNR